MTAFIKKLFGMREKPKEKGFSAFFHTASETEKVDLLRRVVKEANEDQKRLMEEAEGALSKRPVRT